MRQPRIRGPPTLVCATVPLVLLIACVRGQRCVSGYRESAGACRPFNREIGFITPQSNGAYDFATCLAVCMYTAGCDGFDRGTESSRFPCHYFVADPGMTGAGGGGDVCYVRDASCPTPPPIARPVCGGFPPALCNGLPPPSVSSSPSRSPTRFPSLPPTRAPTVRPTELSSRPPTQNPTASPTRRPTERPTVRPTERPTQIPLPTRLPTATPTRIPTPSPSQHPTLAPTESPTRSPTHLPTSPPTSRPTVPPTATPTASPTAAPTAAPASATTGGSAASDGGANGGVLLIAIVAVAVFFCVVIAAVVVRTRSAKGKGWSSKEAPRAPMVNPMYGDSSSDPDTPTLGGTGRMDSGPGVGVGATTAAQAGNVYAEPGQAEVKPHYVKFREPSTSAVAGGNNYDEPLPTALPGVNPSAVPPPSAVPWVYAVPTAAGEHYGNGAAKAGYSTPETVTQYALFGGANGENQYAIPIEISPHSRIVDGVEYDVQPQLLQPNEGQAILPEYATTGAASVPIVSRPIHTHISGEGAFGHTAAVDKWIAAGVGRTEAERRLTTGDYEVGAFCIRAGSGGASQLVLSVLGAQNRPVHFRIVNEDGRVKLADAVAGGDATFKDVHELVAYFGTNPLSAGIPQLAGCVPPPGSVEAAGDVQQGGTGMYAVPKESTS